MLLGITPPNAQHPCTLGPQADEETPFDETAVTQALRDLSKIPMTIEALRATKIDTTLDELKARIPATAREYVLFP